jgi:hypothetical protein
MRNAMLLLFLSIAVVAQDVPTAKLPPDDAVRIQEFYRLASAIQDNIWPGWSKVAAPLMLVTSDSEFLTHDAAASKGLNKISDDVYARPRQFPIDLQATFPLFGPPAVIVIGEPEHTQSKTSTPWLCTVMHEHFHQLQWAQPGYAAAVDSLDLKRGDNTGMWMLNYPFPYDKPEIDRSFGELRDLLLRALDEKDEARFRVLAKEYIARRKTFFAQLSPDDHKYFSFQLWQEGIARYTEVKAAEAAADYRPTAEFAALPDFESFASYAARVRAKTLDELKQVDLAGRKRIVVYSFGAGEGFLLDRINPDWKKEYFRKMLSTDSFFVVRK